ncbi:MAG: OmpA family protein [Microscillaceae bacterium]|nr:OmpA family protein [Microscillaceae bacterium]MDW8461682.1 OmpA family protein [Cytophagales bacterium]
MRKLTLFLSTFLCFCSYQVALAQKEAKSAKEIQKLMRDANMTQKYGEHTLAIDLYNQLLAADPENLEANYGIGKSYLAISMSKEATPYLEKAYKVDSKYKNVAYLLAQAYQRAYRFEEAKAKYKEAKTNFESEKSNLSSITPKKSKDRKAKEARLKELDFLIKDADRKLQECDNAIFLNAQPVNATIENVGDKINTAYDEYVPLVNEKGDLMIYTARRPETKGGNVDLKDGRFFEDVYISKKTGDSWGPGTPYRYNKRFHDAAAAISPDGKIIILYRDNPRTKGDLYESDFDEKKGEFGKARKMNKNINTKYQETSACFTEDGKTMYFTSSRPGGLGGLDIYVTKKEGNSWGPAKNIGAPVNTEYDEESPFITYNGKALYFSSKGHNSMGGYDVFKSVIGEDGKFGPPENVGTPINSPEDDLFFTLSKDDKQGFYTSAREGGKGQRDIYVLYAPKPVLASLNKKDLQSTPKQEPSDRDKDIKNFAFRVFFGFDQDFTYNNEYNKGRLEYLRDFMKKYPDLKIELSGHTDIIGPFYYNQLLSERRAKYVYNYLVKEGVNKDMLQIKGYSYSKPIDTNATDKGRYNNRRVDAEIISGF